MPLVAKGLRIVEFADFVFVPMAGAVLACWGADVIKVEHHERGDGMRGTRTHQLDAAAAKLPLAPRNVNFEIANRGKRSIGINLSSKEGRSVFYALVKEADVFLTNRTGPVIRKLGIGLEEIRAQNPKIIYARGTAHGPKGPEGDRGGFDTADFWYRSGIAEGVHVPGALLPPFMPSPAFGDSTSGMHIAGGILGALYHRERTGEALAVDVSLFGSGLWSLGTAVAMSALTGEPLKQNPHGNHPSPMHDIYRTKDGKFINMCTMHALQYFEEFCRLLDLVDLAKDERFNTQEGYDANGKELTKIFWERIETFTYEEILKRLESYSGQWAPVQDSALVASDQQLIANGYLGHLTASTGQPMKAVQPPIQFDGTPVEFPSSPQFNQHGDEVLMELGMDEQQILDLRIAGAVT